MTPSNATHRWLAFDGIKNGSKGLGVMTRNARCYCMPYNSHHSHPEVLDDPLGLWGQYE